MTLLCDEISFSDLIDNLRHVFRVTYENISLDAPSSDGEHCVYTTNKSLKLMETLSLSKRSSKKLISKRARGRPSVTMNRKTLQ